MFSIDETQMLELRRLGEGESPRHTRHTHMYRNLGEKPLDYTLQGEESLDTPSHRKLLLDCTQEIENTS